MVIFDPYEEFKEISKRSYYSKYYDFQFKGGSLEYENWYNKEINHGYSNRIGRRNTLVIANRILEFRIWLKLRTCRNYRELLQEAITITNTSEEGLVFVSCPLYSHPKGIQKGIRELRKVLIEIAEDNKGLIFNQIPFLNLNLPHLKTKEAKDKFEEFYEPLIQSKVIAKVVMTADWESSLGCKTEFDSAVRYLKQIEYYKPLSV